VIPSVKKPRPLRLCEVIYVKHKDGNGWKWRPIVEGGEAPPCAKTYELFYDCVAAARSKGYDPNKKCL